ncbi:MAG: class IV adenylate cyclase [Patescibacteria group bacterium]
MKEIEILISVKDDKKTVLEKLEQFNFVGVKKVLDIYFYDPKRPELKPDKFGKLNQCLRVRRKDDKFYLTYKIDHFDKDIWIYSDEHETEISDLETCMKIMEHMGLKVLVEVENQKYTFLTDKYEIVFEEVKGLGLFLEVERLNVGDDEKVGMVKEEIKKFIQNLNIKIGEELNVGKPELMLKLKNSNL